MHQTRALRALDSQSAMHFARGLCMALCAIGRNLELEYARPMNAHLRKLPVDERIRLVEDLWDSIAADQSALPLTTDQSAELDRRLATYEADGNPGRPASDVIADIRKKL
jgi:putative addiction module component (TIGR02574 family)